MKRALLYFFLIGLPAGVSLGFIGYILTHTPPNEAYIHSGDTQFELRCSQCHGLKGQGLSGPNLTDDMWTRCDGSVDGIASIIANGVPGTAMPGWGKKLKPEDIRVIAEYVEKINAKAKR